MNPSVSRCRESVAMRAESSTFIESFLQAPFRTIQPTLDGADWNSESFSHLRVAELLNKCEIKHFLLQAGQVRDLVCKLRGGSVRERARFRPRFK